MTDLITTYYPPLSELTETQLQDVRTRLVAYLQQSYPDLDMRPDSVFGNLFINPATTSIAALEAALGRVLSDLDLENTANGVTFDCEFVRKYLNNFAVLPTGTIQSAGVLRFLFSADGPYFIDRRAQYQFGEDIFFLKLAEEGGLVVNAVGTPLQPGSNNVTLTQVTQDLYAFDWPVYGPMTEQVEGGDTAATNYPLDNLTSITAAADFQFGAPEMGLQELAKKARETFYSASMNNRGCARRFLMKEFPDITAASPVLTGDFEMIRDSVNALGFSAGALDALAKSSGYNTTDQVTVRLHYLATQLGNPLNMFVGEVGFTSYPLRIDSVVYAGDTTINLNPSGDALKIFSQSADSSRAPMAAAAFSGLDRYWFCIPMPLDPATGAPLIVPGVLPDGSQFADFTITYRTDPLLPGLSAWAGSAEVAAVGVDTLVKSFVPISIRSMDVRYVKAPGTTVQVENARQEIAAYLNSLGGPVALYSDSRIYDLLYYAGIKDTRAIVTDARVLFSIATHYLGDGVDTPDEDYVTALQDAVPAKVITISSSSGFLPQYKDPNFGTPDATWEVIGPRNTSYLIDPESITFTEIL